jgi:hypothetical protein
MSTPITTASTTPTLVLSDLTADVDQFVQQFQQALALKPTWIGNLTTQTSETLIELISTVGSFAQGRLMRESEDVFSETAQSDDAVLSITTMQGLRIARYLPAGVTGTLNCALSVSLPPLTQFSCGGSYFFNRTQLQILAGVPLAVTLYEGQIYSYSMNGLGTERQTFVSSQDGFVISDQDVIIQVNDTLIPKSYGVLWNFDGLPGYADMTLSNGRLLIQFGNLGGVNGQFGTIPQINDTVNISYPITQGANGNSVITINKTVSVTGFPQITGTFSANPTGGANDKPVIAYKNVAAGGFGTYQSAVTKSQYQATIATYPGILDAVTQAQREINPSDYRWMNVIRVSGLTSSPWTQDQITDFTNYCQTVTMYAPYFLWQDPIAVPRDVNMDIYVFNSAVPTQVQTAVETAITNMFAPQPGILMTNFYISDLIDAATAAAAGQISYIIPNAPTGSMIVTAPESPQITYTLVPGGGSLGSLVYAYSVSTTLTTGEVGVPTNWVFPQVISTTASYGITLTWPAVADAATYQVWGRSASGLGILATVEASVLTFADNGSITPTGGPPTTIADTPIRYNSLNSLTINVFYSERQQRTAGSNPTRMANG